MIRALPNHSNILIAEGRRAALCTGCGGAVYARRVAPVTLTHGARTFTIAQRWGTSRIKTQRLTFGFRERHVSLVKIDQTVDDQLTNIVTRTVTDLVTGAIHKIKTAPGADVEDTLVFGSYRTPLLHLVDYTAPMSYAHPPSGLP